MGMVQGLILPCGAGQRLYKAPWPNPDTQDLILACGTRWQWHRAPGPDPSTQGQVGALWGLIPVPGGQLRLGRIQFMCVGGGIAGPNPGPIWPMGPTPPMWPEGQNGWAPLLYGTQFIFVFPPNIAHSNIDIYTKQNLDLNSTGILEIWI